MFPYFQTEYGYGVNADCFDAFQHIADQSIDMVLCDLPYGTTQNKWDSVLPLERLWKEYNRVCRGPVVLTAAQPFTSVLVCSNLKTYKHEWIWIKNKGTNFLNCKREPMREHESVIVFANQAWTYNAQMQERAEAGKKMAASKTLKRGQASDNFGAVNETTNRELTELRVPSSHQKFNRDSNGIHPTQKPVALMEYLIKTYTNEGDKVLDNTAGSMTTGVAAENLKRKWLCIERDAEYYAKAKERFTILGEHS